MLCVWLRNKLLDFYRCWRRVAAFVVDNSLLKVRSGLCVGMQTLWVPMTTCCSACGPQVHKDHLHST